MSKLSDTFVRKVFGRKDENRCRNITAVRPCKIIQQKILLEVEHFFSIYKDLEHKRTQVLGWKDRETAHEVIRAIHQRDVENKTS